MWEEGTRAVVEAGLFRRVDSERLGVVLLLAIVVVCWRGNTTVGSLKILLLITRLLFLIDAESGGRSTSLSTARHVCQ